MVCSFQMAADHEPGSNQQYDRERDLDGPPGGAGVAASTIRV